MFLKWVDETGMFLSIFGQLFLKPGPDHALVWPYHIMVESCKKHWPLNDVERKDNMREGGVLILPNSAGKNS